MDFDLVVRGGLVFDGSGTAPFVGDIGQAIRIRTGEAGSASL